MKNHFKKIFLVAGLALLLGVVLVPQPAHAFDLFDIGSAVIGKIFLFIAGIIAMLGGMFISVMGWVVSTVLSLSLNVVNSPVVKAGFPVTLALANLGFVLAVIIIAIATILRNQTYGVKTFLYRVVVMAVLVNFGLVLAGGAINISDNMTKYFLDTITNNKQDLGERMASAFNPQRLFLPLPTTTQDPATAKQMKGATDVVSPGMLYSISSLLVTIVSVVIILITLAVFAVMLVIRYVYLVLLLVLLPLAWMAWVFPYLTKHFQKWWDKFIQQLIFPPVALFFLWLGVEASKKFLNPAVSQSVTASVGGLATDIIAAGVNVVVLGFLMVGGLIAAQSLGVSFADVGIKAVAGTKDWALGKVGRGASTATGRIAQSKPVKNLATGLQQVGGGTGVLSKIAKYTGGALVAEKAGRGLDLAARQGERGYDHYKKAAAGLTEQQTINRGGQSTGTELATLMTKAQKDGFLQKFMEKNKMTLEDAEKKMGVIQGGPARESGEAMWGRFGDSKARDAIAGALGSEEMQKAKIEMLNAGEMSDGAKGKAIAAAKEMEDGAEKDKAMADAKKMEDGPKEKAMADAADNFKTAVDAFTKDMDKDQVAKFEWKNALSAKTDKADQDAQKILIAGLAENNSALIGSVGSKLKAQDNKRLVEGADTYYKAEDAPLLEEHNKLAAAVKGRLITPAEQARFEAIQGKRGEIDAKRNKIAESISSAAFLEKLAADVHAVSTAPATTAPTAPPSPATTTPPKT